MLSSSNIATCVLVPLSTLHNSIMLSLKSGQLIKESGVAFTWISLPVSFLCVMAHHLCHLLSFPGMCSEVHAKSDKDFGCACQELLLPELFLPGRKIGVHGATVTTFWNGEMC